MTDRSRSFLVDSTLLFLVTVLPRLLLGIFAPTAGGDWENSYRPVALNIFHNGCVSLSDHAAALCEPSWGGNQAPGFSTFVAVVWHLFPGSMVAILGIQSALVAAATVVVYFAVRHVGGSRGAGLMVGALLAASPQHLAWARFASTDALAVTFSLLLIACLLLALHQRRLPIWPLALVMAGAVAVRLDLVLLAVPVALVAFLIHSPRQALLRGFAIALILAVPAAAWTARNLSVGLPAMPPEFFSPKFALPAGYVHWGYGWTVREYQYPGWYYPAVAGAYDRIAIDTSVYMDDAERRVVEEALDKLRNHVGQPIPADIDETFELLDLRRRDAMPTQYWLFYPLQRIVNMWFNPLNSTAWPVDVRPGVIARTAGETPQARLLALALDHPVAALVKVGSASYRLLLLGLAGWAFFQTWQGGSLIWRGLIWAAIAYGLVRTLFFAYFPLVETRYIMPITPWLEVAVVLGLLARFRPQLVPGFKSPCRGS